MYSRLVASLFITCWHLQLSAGFQPHQLAAPRRFTYTRPLLATSGHKNNDDSLENARERLEEMMRPSYLDVMEDTPPRDHPSIDMTGAPLLTTVTRERRHMEKALLESLLESNDALDELWELWFFERGPKAARELRKAEELTHDKSTWALAEVRLRQIISEHGVHWAEPINRLATLLYLQGRFEESKELCERVLRVKPWHFGALSGIVKVNEGLRDYRDAQYWAGFRLPPLQMSGACRRRRGWVKRAIDDVDEALRQMEEHLETWLGKGDFVESRLPWDRSSLEDPDYADEQDDCWQ